MKHRHRDLMMPVSGLSGKCKTGSSHSSVEDPNLLGYYAMLTVK
jgi:hypothetical protein